MHLIAVLTCVHRLALLPPGTAQVTGDKLTPCSAPPWCSRMLGMHFGWILSFGMLRASRDLMLAV